MTVWLTLTSGPFPKQSFPSSSFSPKEILSIIHNPKSPANMREDTTSFLRGRQREGDTIFIDPSRV